MTFGRTILRPRAHCNGRTRLVTYINDVYRFANATFIIKLDSLGAQVVQSITVTISFLNTMPLLHENTPSEQFFCQVELHICMF